MKELNTEVIYILCLPSTPGRTPQKSAILIAAMKWEVVCLQDKSCVSFLVGVKFKEYLLKASHLSSYAVLTSLCCSSVKIYELVRSN